MRREIGIVVGGVALVFAAVAIGWYIFVSAKSPQAVVRRFLQAEAAGKTFEAGAFVRQSADSQLILSMLDTYRQQSGQSIFKGGQISGARIAGDSAEVEVLLPNPPATPQLPGMPVTPPAPMLVPFHLVRENGDWKIDAATTAVSFSSTFLSSAIKQFGSGNLQPPNWTLPGNKIIPIPTQPAPTTPQQAPAPQSSPNSVTL